MKKLLLTISLSTVGFVYAGNVPTLYALHINGINTTYLNAQSNERNLKDKSQLSSTNKYLVWNVVYNPTKSSTPKGAIADGWNTFVNVLMSINKNRMKPN